MGGAWLAPNLNELLANKDTKELLMKTVRMLDTHEEILGLSGHLLAVSRKAKPLGASLHRYEGQYHDYERSYLGDELAVLTYFRF